MKKLNDIPNLSGVRVLVRVDFNVPLVDGKVADDYRIRMAFPTIDFLTSKGAKVILISHAQAPEKGQPNPSLKAMADCMGALGKQVTFFEDYKKARIYIENSFNNGSCILLENLRFFDGEEANDPKFAQELASLADIYVNDAFSVSHREHASLVGVPKLLPSYAGLQLEKEVTYLSRAFNPAHPFLFILGGAKFETKLPLVDKFMKSADFVFIAGALANDFFKLKGYEVGTSLVSKAVVGNSVDGNKNDTEAAALVADLKGFLASPKLLLPPDVTVENKEIKAADQVSATEKILDVGTLALALLKEKISQSKFILWNGPLGMYEDGFQAPTLELARMIGDATKNGTGTVTSIVGGGDTLAAIETLGNQGHFSFVSTGGGAMLDFLAKGTLPAIEALEKADH